MYISNRCIVTAAMKAKIKELELDGEIYHVLELEKPQLFEGDYFPAGMIEGQVIGGFNN